MVIAVCKFSKIFRGSMSPDPLESCLVLKLLKINSAEKNYASKSDENWCSLPEKNSEYAPDMKHFQKTYLRQFPCLNVFAFSQHST